MDRGGRDRRYEGRGEGQVTKMGGGESYRPIARPRSPDTSRYGRDRDRSPLRRDRARSPPRERDRTPPDAYRSNVRDRSPRRRSRSRSPPSYRGRDRTPPREAQNWRSRERARSPPRARSPRGRTPPRVRTPPRARTPPRPRSPLRARTPARARSPVRVRSPVRPRSPLRARSLVRTRSPIRIRSPARTRSPVRTRSPARVRSPVRARSPPRPRSPRVRTPPRRYSPRRDEDRRDRERPRSSRKDDYDNRDSRRRSMSPYDTRLPVRMRSPLPARRSPPTGPRGDWRQRSRSPRRDSRVISGPTSLTWRRRSPSPAAGPDHSGRTSGNNSRRSSPPIHPSRAALTQPPSRDERQSLDSHSTHEPSPFSYRERLTPRERSPARPNLSREDRRSPPVRSPPRGPSALRAPTGPSAARNFAAPARSPPSVPSIGPVTAATATRADNPTLFPPSGPRGYNQPSRGALKGGRGGSFSDRRPDSGPRGGPPLIRAPPNSSPTIPTVSPTTAIPTGPRAASSQTWTTGQPRPSPTITRGSRFDQLTTQPRVHPAIANLPQTIPGGKKDSSYSCIPKDLEMRIKKTEEETERLREELRIKEEKLRKSLKNWDKLERDSKAMGLRSELSERHVRVLAGEGVGGAAF